MRVYVSLSPSLSVCMREKERVCVDVCVDGWVVWWVGRGSSVKTSQLLSSSPWSCWLREKEWVV